MKPPDSRWFGIGLIICLALITGTPASTRTPLSENTDKLIIIDDYLVRGIVIPTLPLKFASHGVLMGGLDTYTLYDLISQYDWDLDTAYRILMCESKGNPSAHNYSEKTKDDSWGLFQINRYGSLSSRPSSEWLLIPENNIQFAYELWQKNSWSPWRNCYVK